MMKNRRSKSLKDSTPNPDSRDMKTTANDNFINISFKYFKDTDKSPAQSISTWSSEDRILDMMLALKYITSENITKVQSTEKLSLSFVAQIPKTMILLYLFLLKFSQTS